MFFLFVRNGPNVAIRQLVVNSTGLVVFHTSVECCKLCYVICDEVFKYKNNIVKMRLRRARHNERNIAYHFTPNRYRHESSQHAPGADFRDEKAPLIGDWSVFYLYLA